MTITLDGTNGITTPATFTGNVNTGQLAGMRNKIINGKMEIAQRGTSFPNITVSGTKYLVDRFFVSAPPSGVTAVVNVSQDTNVPSSNEFQNAIKLEVTTADATVTATKFFNFEQIIEGYNVRDLVGRTFTVSFWVKSPKTGIHCISFRNSVADRSYVMEYTINAANTWEYKTLTVVGGLITAGTWNWTNGPGIWLRFHLMGGVNFQNTRGTWQTGDYMCTANQVNCLDAVGNVFAITGVQLEVGSVATPFEHRPIGTELALCQRYYETGSVKLLVYQAQGTSFEYQRPFSNTKRTVPTIGFSGAIYINASGITTNNITTDSFNPYAVATSLGTCSYQASFTASSEL